MWPYTYDESHWLTASTVEPRPAVPPTLAEMELAARRHRSAVIAGLLKGAYRGLGRLARLALYRRRGVGGKPPRNAVGAD